MEISGVYEGLIVRSVEKFLEEHIEGFFNKNFSSYLQAVEIYKRLEKEMYFKKKKDANETYVPNQYLIFLSEDDYDNLYSEELIENISAQIIAYANKNDYRMKGSLLVKCQTDQKLKKGCFCIETEMHAEIIKSVRCEDMVSQTACTTETIVFKGDDARFQCGEAAKKNLKFARLTVIAGCDCHKTADLGIERVNIGRRLNNEFTLSDRNTSRLHAYIICRNYKHILLDAESLNGTFVNGERINGEYELKNGDEIKIGMTTLLYEVNEFA